LNLIETRDLSNVSHLTSSSSEAATRQKALGKFQEQTVDLSVAFAERKEAADMLSRRAKDIARAAHDLRHGRFKAVARGILAKFNWRLFPEYWLEYRYAWRPLAMDIYGSVKAIEDADSGSYARYRVTTRASCISGERNEVIPHSYSNFRSPDDVVGFPLNTMEHWKCKSLYKVRYDALQANPLYSTLAACGVTNPASTLWEILPFSFVVDWFFNVGSWIANVNALDGYTWLGGSQTRYTQWSFDLQAMGGRSSTTETDYYGHTYGSGTRFDRTVVSVPTTALTLGQVPLSLNHVADSLSLLTQALRGSRSFNRYRV